MQPDYVLWNDQPVQVIRRIRRRKTVAVQVRNGQVFIIVPHDLPLVEIKRIIAQKARWITRKLQQNRLKPPGTKEYVTGERFWFLGQSYRLQLVAGNNQTVVRMDDCILVTTATQAPQEVRAALVAWYQDQAKLELPRRVHCYADKMQVQATSVVIKTYRARWGTCYADGRIALNWKIIMAPDTVIDYVVVHELCHLVHFNHSRAFWQLVQQYQPDYQAAKAWLKAHAEQIQI